MCILHICMCKNKCIIHVYVFQCVLLSLKSNLLLISIPFVWRVNLTIRAIYYLFEYTLKLTLHPMPIYSFSSLLHICMHYYYHYHYIFYYLILPLYNLFILPSFIYHYLRFLRESKWKEKRFSHSEGGLHYIIFLY